MAEHGTTTVLALFKDRRDAESAVRALQSARFDSARLSLAAPGSTQRPHFGRSALAGVVGGAVGCAVVGVIIGFVAGGFVPGIAAWLTGGWIVPLMVGVAGAGTGAVAGLLMSQSMAERGAMYYEDEVAGGRSLVTVHADPDEVEMARRILLKEGAFDAAPIEAPLKKAG